MVISGAPISGAPISGLIEEAAPTPPEPEAARVTGGWLSDEQVRDLRRRAKRAEKAAREHREQKERDKAKLRETLEAAYDRVMLPPERAAAVLRDGGDVMAAVAQVVEPFRTEAPSDGTTAFVVQIDWSALIVDLSAVRALVEALARTQATRAAFEADEEDAVMAILLAA